MQVGPRKACGKRVLGACRPGRYKRPAPRRPILVITGLFELIFLAIRLYVWALILAAVVSTLISFGVLDRRNRIVWTVGDFLYKVTDPVLRPIRNMLPNFGGIDLSPIVAILALEYLAVPLLRSLYLGITTGTWTSIWS